MSSLSHILVCALFIAYADILPHYYLLIGKKHPLAILSHYLFFSFTNLGNDNANALHFLFHSPFAPLLGS